MNYWSSTKSPRNLYKTAYESPEVADHITKNSFIDPVLLAQELKTVGLNRHSVMAYQRRLGVRKFSRTGD